MRARPKDSERGQVLPLLCVVLVLAGAGLATVSTMGRAAIERSLARTAADAAALAGAAGGREEATAVAAANGAVLVEFRIDGSDTVVAVEHGDARARARARRESALGPAGAVGPEGGDRAGLTPEMLAALARADALLGQPVPVVSGFRTRAEQEALWRRRASNPYPVAPPGSSRHETGNAIDVPRSFIDDLLAVAPLAGLCQPLPLTDPVHFERCPPTG